MADEKTIPMPTYEELQGRIEVIRHNVEDTIKSTYRAMIEGLANAMMIIEYVDDTNMNFTGDTDAIIDEVTDIRNNIYPVMPMIRTSGIDRAVYKKVEYWSDNVKSLLDELLERISRKEYQWDYFPFDRVYSEIMKDIDIIDHMQYIVLSMYFDLIEGPEGERGDRHDNT